MNAAKENPCLLIGVSSCLLGNKVRYDGEHSRDDGILESMGGDFELIPFCPEVAIGLGIPRPPIQLVSYNKKIRVRGVNDPSQDVTKELIAYAKLIELQLASLSGYIFKSRSPSCGVRDVDVFDGESGIVVDTSAGQFAKTIMQLYPELPVEDDVRLKNEIVSVQFLERVYRYAETR